MMPEALPGRSGALSEAPSNSRDKPDSSYPFAFATVNARMERLSVVIPAEGHGSWYRGPSTAFGRRTASLRSNDSINRTTC